MLRSTRAVAFGAAYAFLAACVPLATASLADAQWLPDRAYTEGPGIRLGDLELHPGLAVRGGYDTNVFRTPGTAANPEIGSAILAVSPHLNLRTLSRQRLTQGESAAGSSAAPLPAPIAFDLGVSATYFHYFHKDAPKNLEVDFASVLNVLPDRPFGLDVGAEFARNTRPFTERLRRGNDVENNTYAFDRIRPSLLLRGQSRGGMLRGTVGFAPTFTIYESNFFDYLSLFQYDIPATLAWRFLPSTALLYDGVVGLNAYREDRLERLQQGSIFLSDSKRFQSRVGINGALTPTLAIRALVGYAVVMLDEAVLDDHQDVVGDASLTYAWSSKDKAEIGYQRTLELSNLGGWTQLDRGYLRTSMLFARMFALTIEAGVAHVKYGRLLAPNIETAAIDDVRNLGTGTNGDERKDVRIDGGVHAEYRATNWLAVTADFQTLVTLTDFEYAQGVSRVYPGEFKTFQVFGGVRAHY